MDITTTFTNNNVNNNNIDDDIVINQKLIFQTIFDKYILDGVNRNQAAAKALIETHQAIEKIKKDKEKDKNDMNNPITYDNILSLLSICDNDILNELNSNNNNDNNINNHMRNESLSKLMKVISHKFSCPHVISQSFNITNDNTVNNNGNQMDVAINNINIMININEVDAIYKVIMNSKSFMSSIELQSVLLTALENLSKVLQEKTTSFDNDDPSLLKPFLIILEYPLLLDPSPICQVILRNLSIAITKLPLAAKLKLCEWIRDHAGEDRYLRYICVFRQYMTLRIFVGVIEDARVATNILGLLYSAIDSYPNVSYTEFYNDALNEEYMRLKEGRIEEFKRWKYDLEIKRQLGSKAQVNKNMYFGTEYRSFISYPFVLSSAIKASILELDATHQMRMEMDEEIQRMQSQGHRFCIPFLVFRVKRNNIVHDTLNVLEHYDVDDFKKPLKIVFDDEEGVDAGGVRKEYYQLMTAQLLHPDFGMFKYYPESRLLWFNSDSFESDREFELIGKLLGIAIYNSIIIDLRMPSALYKKLKKKRCNLDDLAELQPDLAKGFRELLSFDGNVEETFGQVFQMSYDFFGERRTIDLKENGANISVTNHNRDEYVDLYVNYVMEKSVEIQFGSFERGFRKVCGGPSIDLFEAKELELLVCGSNTLNFEELRMGTKYDDGYDENSIAIHNLWKILLEFDEEEKRQFLKFLSGSDRSPIDGLRKLEMVVSKNGNEDNRLPSAHTCFNHLLLPEYSTIEIMREKLKYAITQSEGFGLR